MTPERGQSPDKLQLTNKPPNLVKNERKERKRERKRERKVKT